LVPRCPLPRFQRPRTKTRCIAPLRFPVTARRFFVHMAPPESRRSKEAPMGQILSIENSSGLRSDVAADL